VPFDPAAVYFERAGLFRGSMAREQSPGFGIG